MSDSELIESKCDGENEEQTWYPSESVVEEWKVHSAVTGYLTCSLKISPELSVFHQKVLSDR